MKAAAILLAALVPVTIGLVLVGYLGYALAALLVGCAAC